MWALANIVGGTRSSSMAAPDQRPASGSGTESESETFKLKMELLVAERRYSDLLLKNKQLDNDKEVLTREVELQSAAGASALQHAEEQSERITTLVDQLSRVRTDSEAAEQETGQIREQNQALQSDKSQLSNELSLLRTTNIELDERNQQLSLMHNASQEAVKNLTDAARFLRAQNESNEQEMGVLQDRIAAAEVDRDW
jgi:chromosome segregation ATPase